MSSGNSKQSSKQEKQMEEDDDSKIFPQRLMEMLSNEKFSDAIAWLPHGRAFIIKDRNLFTSEVMPLYFSRKAKYSSFTRKLNRWNFVRVSSGPELGAYFHEFFLRDKPHLAAQMFCKNARSKLAMASDTPAPAKPAPVEPVTLAPPQPLPQQHMMMQQDMPIPSALLAALQNKLPDSTNWSNLQMLQTQMEILQLEQARQLEMLQREQAKRLLMERIAMQNSGSQHLPAASTETPQAASTQTPQAAKLMQMRQLMDVRTQQRQGQGPTNHRASAA